MRASMALHILISSVKRAQELFSADRVIYCLEGRSWRKDVYARYKKHRVDARLAAGPKEQEEDKKFWDTLDHFNAFLREKSGALVLRHPQVEADDLIARWTQVHPDDQHVIVSSDRDFYQLLSDRVKIFNGITKEIISRDAITDDKFKPIMDKKTGMPKSLGGEPAWLLFEKCMRGDPGDNVFTAYPRVRKTQLLEAYKDRTEKGFKWNNLMLQRWVDHDGAEHRVIDDYERNCQLIDLAAQPDWVKAALDETITAAKSVEVARAQAGAHFMKFCGIHGLDTISNQAQSYMTIFR
jgi:5'-3' exonuclease